MHTAIPVYRAASCAKLAISVIFDRESVSTSNLPPGSLYRVVSSGLELGSTIERGQTRKVDRRWWIGRYVPRVDFHVNAITERFVKRG
jgi:hypothetical protein